MSLFKCCRQNNAVVELEKPHDYPPATPTPTSVPSSDVEEKTAVSEELLPPPARPQVFAIMRNGHEVIRGAMKDIDGALAKDDMDTVRSIWKNLNKWEQLHLQMEEGSKTGSSPIGVFQMLDNFGDDVATKAGLRDTHTNLEDIHMSLDNAFQNNDTADSKLMKLWEQYKESEFQHLQEEEETMMPVIQKMATSGNHDMKKLMQEDVWPMISGGTADQEEKYFIQYANQILQNHEEGQPRVRVMNHAIWAISTPDEWKERSQWIQEVLSDDKYQELVTAISDWKEFQQLPGDAKKARMAVGGQPKKS